MKILKRQISAKDGSGVIVLRPETPEDLWHSYNLLQKDDLVRCTTVRKVVKETATGSTSSQKKRMSLTIKLEKIDFDPESLELRVSGITTAESDFVRLGSHHTLTLELQQNFSLEKSCWDQIYLDLIEEACHPERQSQVTAVVMQVGLAHVCLIAGSLTIVKARISVNIPKKRTGSSQHAKSLQKFYEQVYQALLRHTPWETVKIILLASPGFVKDDFYQYLKIQSVQRNDSEFVKHADKFLLAKASSGHKHALDEVLCDAAILAQMEDTKVAKETQELQKFMRMLDTDPMRAFYGYTHVSKANEQLAIESLLVTDELFRNSNVTTRKLYVSLVESVREHGGNVYIFSSMHVSGQQLQQVSGVAAILRYPLPDLDEMEQVAYEWQSGEMEQESDADEEEYDPEARIREDMNDMGL
jgi:protein pelota